MIARLALSPAGLRRSPPLGFLVFLLVIAVPALHAQQGPAKDDLDLAPTRPTVANSAAVQSKGVLQIEVGYDTFPQAVPGAQQAIETAFFYTPWSHARLDFSWTPFARVHDAEQEATGVGTLQLGTKLVFVKDGTYRWLPGLGMQYGAELPTASDAALQGYGQQAIFETNHELGRVNLIVNASVVQTNCRTRAGCNYGGQQSVALAYHQSPHTSIYAESFAQNVAQSNAPPGTYVFGGFLHKFTDAFGINAGMRFGITDHAASVGVTVGVVLGKRLQSAGKGSAATP